MRLKMNGDDYYFKDGEDEEILNDIIAKKPDILVVCLGAPKQEKWIYKNLEKAANEKDDIAVEKMAYAQYIAGMGFSNVGLGIVHSMAHSLGAYFDTPHGLANALLLPHVLRFNGKVCPELFENMGRAFGLDMDNTSDEEAIDMVVGAVQDLSRRLNIPQTLRELGIPEEMFGQLANQAINDACTPGNPREVTVDDIINIYKAAY